VRASVRKVAVVIAEAEDPVPAHPVRLARDARGPLVGDVAALGAGRGRLRHDDVDVEHSLVLGARLELHELAEDGPAFLVSAQLAHLDGLVAVTEHLVAFAIGARRTDEQDVALLGLVVAHVTSSLSRPPRVAQPPTRPKTWPIARPRPSGS